MKLAELRVKHFRAIGSGKDDKGLCILIENNDIIFLLGKNNAGKSSILSAYDYFFNDTPAQDDDFHKKQDLTIEIEIRLKSDSEDEIRQLKLVADIPDLKNDHEIRVKKEWRKVEPNKPKKFIWVQGNWEEVTDKKPQAELKLVLERELPTPIWIRGMSTSSDVLSKIKNLIKEAVIRNLVESEEYKTATDALKALQKLVSGSQYSTQLKTSISQTLKILFPDISLEICNESEEIDLVKIIEGFTRVQTLEDKGESISLDWQGHGLQRHFIFSVYKECHDQIKVASSKSQNKKPESLELKPIDKCRKTKILLIEEPELFLHPTAIRSIRDLLYELAQNSGFQILCATHSPIMIDLKQPQNSLVRVVNEKGCGTLAHQVSDRLLPARTLEEFNPYVCESFFADKVILVEGATEVITIKLLLEELKKEYGNLTDELHIVCCNGKTTIPAFQQILTHFKIEHFIFHDSDAPRSADGRSLNVWSINKSIWARVLEARSAGLNVRRFVSVTNFESANGYAPLPKGKPATAYEQAKCWIKKWTDQEVQSKPIVTFLREVLSGEEMLEDHTQEWIEKQDLKEVPDDFVDEQLSLFPIPELS